MASDAYLQLDGIKGESQDQGHTDWIEVSGVRWGIQQPKSATSSTAGGHTAERAELTDITFEKIADLASPILMQTCAMGKTIPKAKFEFMRADGNGEPIKYFEVELENVLIGMISPLLSVGLHQETVGLKFSQVKWRYTKQKVGGGASGNTAGSWNLATNRMA
ncbi:Hcp family type VI secretion system effector [Massilia brevitalea]|uniref:Hcp family type VI secretion system effector n=1 Tax=Massilia brevitalea TaxID=442526 RepID=UPI00273A159F|nr:type VI secretion system tube protein Hcp [Massilia brevitalea]